MQEIFYDSKSTSSGIMCMYGSHTFFQSVGCVMFKLQFRTDLPETEIISLDAGLWLDRRPVLDLRDLIVAIFHGNTYRAAPHKLQTVKKTHGMMIWTMSISYRRETLLYIFQDNEAVIKMIIKGRSQTLRHVSRSHRVALDWLFDRINLDSKIHIKNIDTKNQLADILTKRKFTRDEWNHLLFFFSTSAISVPPIVLKGCRKRTQQDASEERVTA